MKNLLYIITGLSLYFFIVVYLKPWATTIILFLKLKYFTNKLKRNYKNKKVPKELEVIIDQLDNICKEGLKTKL